MEFTREYCLFTRLEADMILFSYKTHDYFTLKKTERERETTFYNSKHSLVCAFGEKTKAIIKEIT